MVTTTCIMRAKIIWKYYRLVRNFKLIFFGAGIYLDVLCFDSQILF